MDDYTPKGSLGPNAMLVKRIKDGKYFVLRQVNYKELREDEKKRLIERINTLKILTSGHHIISKLHNPFVTDGNINIPTEYYGTYTIETMISDYREQNKQIKEDFIWNVIAKICLELYDLHSHNPPVGHGAITASNIHLLKNSDIKLTNFEIDPNDSSQLSPQNDMFQIGILIFEMATLRKFDIQRRKENETVLSSCPEGIRRAVTELTLSKSDERPDVTKVLSIPEIAVIVLESKLEHAKETYESEKRQVRELEEEIAIRKKRLEQAGVDLSRLEL